MLRGITMAHSNRGDVVLLLLYFSTFAGVFAEYKIVYLEDSCKSNEVLRILLGAYENDTAQIIKASREPTSLPNRNCSIYVLPPLGHGITLSIRYLNMNPLTEPSCENYVLIIDTERPESNVYLCSHMDDPTEYQSYSSNGRLELLFHTEHVSDIQSYFTFSVTAFVEAPRTSTPTYCPLNWLKCDNNHCVWEGLSCDGHNNCGDQSDERSYSPSFCNTDDPDNHSHGGVSVSVVLAISLGALFGFLLFIVLPLVYCCNRLKNQRRDLDEERRRLYASSRNEVTAENRQCASGATTPYHAESGGVGNTSYQDQPPAYKP